MHTIEMSAFEYRLATEQLHQAWEFKSTIGLWSWWRKWFGVPRF